METIHYKLKKIEGEYKEAKIIEYNNSLLEKNVQFPSVMFHVQSTEDLEVIKQYYFQQYPNEHIFGFTIPFHKLGSYVHDLIGNVPQNITLMCDIESEIFWYGMEKLKPSMEKFYINYASIPSKIKTKIKRITTTKKFKDRIEKHKKFWQDIINDKNSLVPLLTSYINRQHGYQIDILSGFSPLILDRDHLNFVEECYTQIKKLYHNDTSINLENNGKIIGLYTNLHTTFLTKSENIEEFIKMVERLEPKAIIFKIFNLDDIRSMKIIKKNYETLIRKLSNLSHSMQIPTFYFSTHSAGLKANTNGIDVFSEPFNKKLPTDRRFTMNSEMMRRLHEEDPLYQAGKIYDIKTGNFISRKEFQKNRLTDKKIDSPITELPSIYKPEVIRSMIDRRFRDFSKLLLMESRNYEEAQLHKAIQDNDMENIRKKISIWEGPNIPK